MKIILLCLLLFFAGNAFTQDQKNIDKNFDNIKSNKSDGPNAVESAQKQDEGGDKKNDESWLSEYGLKKQEKGFMLWPQAGLTLGYFDHNTTFTGTNSKGVSETNTINQVSSDVIGLNLALIGAFYWHWLYAGLEFELVSGSATYFNYDTSVTSDKDFSFGAFQYGPSVGIMFPLGLNLGVSIYPIAAANVEKVEFTGKGGSVRLGFSFKSAEFFMRVTSITYDKREKQDMPGSFRQDNITVSAQKPEFQALTLGISIPLYVTR